MKNLHNDEIEKVINTCFYDKRIPLTNDIASTLKIKPKLLEGKNSYNGIRYNN
ncbi:hypothetical protein [Arcobacter sp.]|uniref:hypothetical protein n=1 Tax=Arcobacter sp. TaxID=1872629 RepID=UPI003D119682